MRGVRFAPSPTGTFHLGNLRTAWVSHAIARDLAEPWVVRVEDIDSQRVLAGAWELQLRDLKLLSLNPDETVLQTERRERHFELFEKARAEGRIYPCDCSRKEVLEALRGFATAPHEEAPAYSGHCRNRKDDLSVYQPAESLAWRWRREGPGDDVASGHFDAIIARTAADGLKFTSPALRHFSPGYHWACAIDDADGDYRILVRAWDLATSDPIQREIRRWVNPKSEPTVFHTALLTRDDGGRLEKRTQGVTLSEILAEGKKLNLSPEVVIREIVAEFENSFDRAKARLTIQSAPSSASPLAPVGEPTKSLSLGALREA